MWLVNTKSLNLEYCDPPSRDVALDTYLHDAYSSGSANGTLPYAILSHRWQQQEVTFDDMKDSTRREQKQGWKKIENACRQARVDGISHIWIDTCCINKDSETELSESIKSMYAYYQQAQVCYAYLHSHSIDQPTSFDESEWFSRGWTLQELVAPRKLSFFDKKWNHYGDKSTLSHKLSEITRIDEALLNGNRSVDSFCVAERMSWAALRHTTRAEDRAYSLIGIFDVDIPTVYGEGGLRAFARLQQAIVAASDDATIFAWPMYRETRNYGMLALAPNAFADCAKLRSVSTRKSKVPAAFTSRGLQVTLPLAPWSHDTYMAILDCAEGDEAASYEASRGRGQTGIFLRKLIADDTFVRISVDGKDRLNHLSSFFRGKQRPAFRDVRIFIRQGGLSRSELSLFNEHHGYGFQLSTNILGMPFKQEYHAKLAKGAQTMWYSDQRTIMKETGALNYAHFISINLNEQKMQIREARLFMDWEFNPIVFMAEHKALEEKRPILNKSGNLISNPTGQQWDEKELAGFQSFHTRTILDKYGWNEVTVREGKQLAQRSSMRDGLWMLKGDRLDGLDVYCAKSGPPGGYFNSSPSTHFRVRVERRPVMIGKQEQLFWHFEIEGMTSEHSIKKLTG